MNNIIPLEFDGEEIREPEIEMPIARWQPACDDDVEEWAATIRLACSDETVRMVNAGYKRFAAKHGWSETTFRDRIHAAAKEGEYLRENAQ